MMRARTNAARSEACPALRDGGAPGQALLATVDDDDAPALLALADWRPAARPWCHSARDVPLAGSLDPVVARAATLGWRTAPVVRVPRPPQRLTAFRVHEQRRADVLQGASIGLGLALGAASWTSGIPLPPRVAALGELGPDGRVVGVRGVAAKARLLAEAGVRTLWVAVADAAAIDADLDVRPVHHLHEVVREVLRTDDLPPPSPEAVRRILAWVELGEPTVSHWEPLQRTLLWMQRTAPDDREAVRHALAIVDRHLGTPTRPPLPEGLERLPRPRRLRRLAHVVQAHADGGCTEPEPLLALADRHLAEPLERCAPDLELLGAMGRLAAATGRLALAWRHLDDAVTGWSDIDRPVHASRSVCELVRIAGLLRAADAVARARDAAAHLAPLLLDPVEQAYLGLALGRLAVQVGGDPGALEQALEQGPPHIQASARRWWRRAGRLGPDVAPHTSAHALHALDRALAAGHDPQPALDALRAHRPDRYAQVRAWCPADVDPARHVAEAWPY